MSPSRAGFTLIEIMAVVLIMSFLMAMVLPGLSVTSGAIRRDEAQNLSARLQLARQRAVMTGKPHRVLIDVDRGAYHIEWFVSAFDEAEDEETEPLIDDEWVAPEEIPPSRQEFLSLKPPEEQERAYVPIPNQFGRDHWLHETLYFDGVETYEGWFDEGSVAVVFEGDGTTDPAQIVITDADGFGVTLDVLPLLESVRIRYETEVE
ncbi:MAG: GspH/FimT family pseudopilin [Deltaproteobacteria bacterium]|nr:GspH/FimT family pseudopilin [Deltaproteobacteria bacterium]MBW2421693.1 GspH/FimT family pseudopilin [Deltaproteobacteria bacterium]